MYNTLMIRKELYLTEQQVKKLEEKKLETGLTHSEIIRRALDFFFSKEKHDADNNKERR